jgi:hypothetical protein
MLLTENIVKIQDLFDGWRAAGHQILPNGVELIGLLGDAEAPCWLHAVFPGLSPAELDALERSTDTRFPGHLRAIYRLIGGMTLFNGAFRMFGRRGAGIRTDVDALQAGDLAELNHEIDAIGWKPNHAVAFAVNSWDQSVHLAGMGHQPQEIVRCDRATGRVIECHADVFECLCDRLYRLDQVMLA